MNTQKNNYVNDTITQEMEKEVTVKSKEIMLLAMGLIERGIAFRFRRLYDGYQIIAADESWDVICHNFSYGGNLGLLEIMGKYAEDDVEGYLTADAIFARIDEGVDE